MRRAWIYALAVIGVALYAYPGLMSYDSAFQLDEARRWDLGDQHPPLMSAIWRLCELVVAGPLGMLALQTAAFITGLGKIFARQHVGALATLIVAWYPPVLVVMAVIWKDSQMAAYLALGIAGMLSPRRERRWAGLGLMLVASALRHNAPAATLVPVVLLWSQRSGWRRYVLGLAAWLAITLGSVGITKLLANRPGGNFSDMIEVTDICGTIRYSPPIADADLRELLAGTPLRVDHDIQAAMVASYAPKLYLEFAQHSQPLELASTVAERAAISRAWRAIVVREPLAYLRQRWTMFARLLEIRASSSTPAFVTFDDPSNAGRTPTFIQRGLFRAVRAIGPLWYVPFIYFVVGLCLLAFARTRLELAVLGSGIVYELGMFPVILTGDYRYSHWLIATVAIATILIVCRRAQR